MKMALIKGNSDCDGALLSDVLSDSLGVSLIFPIDLKEVRGDQLHEVHTVLL